MIQILYSDRQLVVCRKPSGVLSEGTASSALPVLLSHRLREQGEERSDIYPVHRLDRDTEGLMVFARTSASAAALSRSFAEHQTEKEYWAVVCGKPSTDSGRLEDWLFYDRMRGKSFVVQRERKGVKAASLEYALVEYSEPYSLLRIFLHTGRTHQIRVQFASRGMPLYGDRRYGAPPIDSPLLLCARRLSFPHPVTQRRMNFCTSPTDCFWNRFSAVTDEAVLQNPSL